jgi:hypothetical protein
MSSKETQWCTVWHDSIFTCGDSGETFSAFSTKTTTAILTSSISLTSDKPSARRFNPSAGSSTSHSSRGQGPLPRQPRSLRQRLRRSRPWLRLRHPPTQRAQCLGNSHPLERGSLHISAAEASLASARAAYLRSSACAAFALLGLGGGCARDAADRLLARLNGVGAHLAAATCPLSAAAAELRAAVARLARRAALWFGAACLH